MMEPATGAGTRILIKKIESAEDVAPEYFSDFEWVSGTTARLPTARSEDARMLRLVCVGLEGEVSPDGAYVVGAA